MQLQTHNPTPAPTNIRPFPATYHIAIKRPRRRVFRWRVCVTNLLTLLARVAVFAASAVWLAGLIVWLFAWALTW